MSAFGVSCLKLLDEELYVGGDDFFRGLRLGGGGQGSEVAGWCCCCRWRRHGCSWCGFSVFEWLCCVCPKHALALAHASRGGKCKERGISHPERTWRAAEGRSAQAKRGRLGILLARARDGVPQQAWFPWHCAQRMIDCVLEGGRCGKERPAEEGAGRRQLHRRLETGKKPPSRVT